MTEQQKIEHLSKLVEQANAALREAEQFATDNNLSFRFDPAYGIGGWFESGEWNPSSMSC